VKAVRVVLSELEIKRATTVGIERQLCALAQGRRPYFVTPCGLMHANIVGALGELTVAKALGREWAPNVGGNDSATGDVAGLHVRASVARMRLPIREGDPDAGAFVFVTGEPPELVIRGWMRAGDAKAHPEWRDRGPFTGNVRTWGVPAGELEPWASLDRDGRP
jgi:hypothetical protein